MMRLFILFIPLLFFCSVSAQVSMTEKQVTVGSKVLIVKCKPGAPAVESMDLYVKTRYPDKGIVKDSLTGEGVFEWFFSTGDFDAKRLPCSYTGKTYTVAALRELPDTEKEGVYRRIVLCYGTKPLEMIWIEFDKAVELKEISF